MAGNKLLFISIVCYIATFKTAYWDSPSPELSKNVVLEEEQFFNLEKVTSDFRTFLKLHANISDHQPKKLSEMTIYEMVQQINPWKAPEPINICDDQIGCLMVLLFKIKYSELRNHAHDFAASYGFDLKEYQIVGFILCATWAIKTLTRFVYLKFYFLFIDLFR